MQYSFTLPADYDMAIVRQRIADKGHLLDHFDGLLFKAYLYAERGAGSDENLYAPFYVWHDSAAMQRFLGSEGFARLSQAFGWPAIRVWPVWDVHALSDARQARHATREIQPIAPYAALDALREEQRVALQQDVEQSALAAVSAFEPTTWTRVNFRLWSRTPPAGQPGQWYHVGHVSQP